METILHKSNGFVAAEVASNSFSMEFPNEDLSVHSSENGKFIPFEKLFKNKSIYAYRRIIIRNSCIDIPQNLGTLDSL